MKRKKLFNISFLLLLAAISVLTRCTSKPKQVRYLPILGIGSINPATNDSVYHTIDTFKVTDQLGQIITQDSFKNKIYVANFFFVSCPGICKQMNNELEDVEKAFERNPEIKFLSFTVNPAEDTTAALMQYAKLHDAVPYQWYFLRGNKDATLRLATQSFLAERSGYLVHSQNLTLVDWQGRIRGVYSGTVESEVNRLIADIKLLTKEKAQNMVTPAKS